MEKSNGILKNLLWNTVNVTVSSEWIDSSVLYQNKASNLIDFNACSYCRWWSNNIPNSYVVFSFQKEFVLTKYSMETVSDNYPKSWEVYYSINKSDWMLLDNKTENNFHADEYSKKKIRVKPTKIQKIKFVQKKNSISSDVQYGNCFAMKRFEFFTYTATRCVCKVSDNIFMKSFLCFLFS